MKKPQKVTQQMANLWRQYQVAKPNHKFWKAYEKAFREAKNKRQLPAKLTFKTSEEAHAHLPKKEFLLTLKLDIELLEDYISTLGKTDWLEVIGSGGIGIIFWAIGAILGLINRAMHLLYRGVFRLFGKKIPLKRIPVKFESDHIWFSQKPRALKVPFKDILEVRQKREYLVITTHFKSYYLVMLDEWGKSIPETQTIVDLLKLVIKENKVKLAKASIKP